MSLAPLILACSPFVSPDTMTTYIEQRSQADPLAIHITETDRWIRPKDQAEAIAAAKKLVEDGMDIEAGLAQIKSAEWAKYELTPETVFDPCKNLAAAERVLVTAYGKPKRSSAKSQAGKRKITGLVRELAPKYSLDPKLVLAVIETESNFNPKARSPKNARGLMQLIPATAQRFGVRNVWDPEQNLRGGMAYLRWLLKHFKGDVKLALAGYNAGEKAVERHGGIPPYCRDASVCEADHEACWRQPDALGATRERRGEGRGRRASLGVALRCRGRRLQRGRVAAQRLRLLRLFSSRYSRAIVSTRLLSVRFSRPSLFLQAFAKLRVDADIQRDLCHGIRLLFL